MALFRDLVSTIAEAEGLSEMTVTGVGQYLRDAGKISKFGRGKSGAKMTTTDAATLLIGVNASELAKDAVQTVETYASLPLSDAPHPYDLNDNMGGGEALKQVLHNPANAVECIAGLVRLCIPDRRESPVLFLLNNDIEVVFHRPTPRIDVSVFQKSPSRDRAFIGALIFSSANHVAAGDRRVEIKISTATLRAVGSLLVT